MEISAPKSTVTLFTTWTKQVALSLDVRVSDVVVPTVKNPRLLGVILDPTFSFSSHAISIARKAASRLNIMKALSNSVFGKDRECLLCTFQLFIRSLFSYAAPVVFPNYSSTSINRLQRVQNSALRLALGCHSTASFEHIHNEAKELPVSDHLRLLSSQFLARALQENHPSHRHVIRDKGRRSLAETLRSKCIDVVTPYLNESGKIGAGDFQRVKSAIHTDIVAEAIDRLGSSRVLNGAPPQVDKSEVLLPRLVRSTLSQLRSGFCARLKDYQFRIKKADNDVCPECNAASHTTAHLFDCQAHPTNLVVESLWSDPWGVANFLPQLPSFQFLPDVGPPPPPRPRRRRRPPPDPPPVFSPMSLPPSPFLFTPPPLSPPHTPPRPGYPPPLMQQRVRLYSYASISSFSFSSSSPPSSPRSQALSHAESDRGNESL